MPPLIRAARPADMPAVYELLSTCFADARPNLFPRQSEHDSTRRRRHTRVVEVGRAPGWGKESPTRSAGRNRQFSRLP